MDGPTASVELRVQAIEGSTTSLRKLISGRTFEDPRADAVGRPAFERFLQIVSDASARLPDGWKAGRPDVPWQALADLGDVIMTEYDRIDLDHLWRTADAVLDPLDEALLAAVASGRRDIM
jgi:uncharacterized protein with HEPN domain